MKRILLYTLCFVLVFNSPVLAQKVAKEKTKKEKVVKEKTKKEKVVKEKTKKEKVSKEKKEKKDPFVYETKDSENFTKESREAISKPVMPKYDVAQGFHKGKKKAKQENAFLNKKYYFPSKPHNAWQIGLFGGMSVLNGDVQPNFLYGNKPALPGHNFGVHVTKAWSYIFATRLRYSTFTMLNTDSGASTLTSEQFNAANTRSSGLAGYAPGQQFFHNSRTQGHDLTMDFIISFGNLAFHKERTNFNFKVFPAVGVMMYQTAYDHFDANGNAYNYTTLANNNNLGVNSRSDVLKNLATMRDGKYETRAENHTVTDEQKFLNYNPRLIFGIGGGFTIRLAKWIYLDIETRQMFTNDDLMDGVQWQEPSGISSTNSKGLTRGADSYNQTTVGLTFNLIGKKTAEPLTMMNPMHYSYAKVGESDPEAIIADLLKDNDGDGVPNKMDQEEDTQEGAPVDPKGIALDSDKDGIIDFNDDEPFSPPGFPVDDRGVATGTEAQLQERVENIVNNMVKNSTTNNGGNSSSTSGNGGLFNGGSSSCNAMSVELPSVHFDKDKYNIKPEFYAHLYEVAQRLLVCPGAKVLATGMADKDDNSKYNEQLSYNRVDAVIDYLTTTYGIDRERFVVKYNGEASANGKTASEQYLDRKVHFKLVENETGVSNPSEPHPGMKAGKAK